MPRGVYDRTARNAAFAAKKAGTNGGFSQAVQPTTATAQAAANALNGALRKKKTAAVKRKRKLAPKRKAAPRKKARKAASTVTARFPLAALRKQLAPTEAKPAPPSAPRAAKPQMLDPGMQLAHELLQVMGLLLIRGGK